MGVYTPSEGRGSSSSSLEGGIYVTPFSTASSSDICPFSIRPKCVAIKTAAIDGTYRSPHSGTQQSVQSEPTEKLLHRRQTKPSPRRRCDGKDTSPILNPASAISMPLLRSSIFSRASLRRRQIPQCQSWTATPNLRPPHQHMNGTSNLQTAASIDACHNHPVV